MTIGQCLSTIAGRSVPLSVFWAENCIIGVTILFKTLLDNIRSDQEIPSIAGASDYVKYISDNGGRRNGATGFTYTYYYFKVIQNCNPIIQTFVLLMLYILFNYFTSKLEYSSSYFWSLSIKLLRFIWFDFTDIQPRKDESSQNACEFYK